MEELQREMEEYREQVQFERDNRLILIKTNNLRKL